MPGAGDRDTLVPAWEPCGELVEAGGWCGQPWRSPSSLGSLVAVLGVIGSDAGGDGLQGVPCSTGHAVATHQGQLASVLLPAVATACPEHAAKPTSFLQQRNAGLCHESLCESPQLARWGSRADFVTKGSCISGCLLLFLIKQPGPWCRPSLWKGVCMGPAPHC